MQCGDRSPVSLLSGRRGGGSVGHDTRVACGNVGGGVEVVRGTRPVLQFAALLVHQQLALGALEALPTQAPDAVLAERARCSLQHNK